MELGEFIKERRAEIGMTQVRLAEMLGRSASTIRSWERGAIAPPADLHSGLASALGIGLGDLEQLAGVSDETVGSSGVDEEGRYQPPHDAVDEDSPSGAIAVAGVLDEDLVHHDVAEESSPSEPFSGDEPAPERSAANHEHEGVPLDAETVDGAALSEDAESIDERHDDLAEQVSSGPTDGAESRVDKTTVMAEGLAMSVPVATPADPLEHLDQLETAEPSPAESLEERHDDTDESEVIEVDGADRSLRPRLLGTALSTDPLVEPEVTQVAAPYAATQISGGRATPTLTASPYPEARAASDIIPEDRGYIGDWTEQRTYQVRRLLTVAGVLILFLMLRWSMGGFLEGFQTLKDSIMSNVNL